MDRRRFLKTVTAATAAVAGGTEAARAIAKPPASGSPSLASGQRLMNFALAWPDNDQGFADSARQFARRVSEMTDGRMAVSFDPLDAALPDKSALEHFDGVVGLEKWLIPERPEAAFFTGLPGRFGLEGDALSAWLDAAQGQLLWDELAAEAGFKPFALAHSGTGSLLWSPTELDDAPTLNAVSVSVDGLAGAVVTALGGDVTMHRAQVVDVPGLAASLALGLPQSGRRLYAPGLYRAGTATSIGLRLKSWAELSGGEKAVFASAAAATFADSLDWSNQLTPLMQNALVQRFAIKPAPLPAQLASAIDRVSDAMVAHVAATNPLSRRINSHYMRFFERRAANGSGLV